MAEPPEIEFDEIRSAARSSSVVLASGPRRAGWIGAAAVVLVLIIAVSAGRDSTAASPTTSVPPTHPVRPATTLPPSITVSPAAATTPVTEAPYSAPAALRGRTAYFVRPSGVVLAADLTTGAVTHQSSPVDPTLLGGSEAPVGGAFLFVGDGRLTVVRFDGTGVTVPADLAHGGGPYGNAEGTVAFAVDASRGAILRTNVADFGLSEPVPVPDGGQIRGVVGSDLVLEAADGGIFTVPTDGRDSLPRRRATGRVYATSATEIAYVGCTDQLVCRLRVLDVASGATAVTEIAVDRRNLFVPFGFTPDGKSFVAFQINGDGSALLVADTRTGQTRMVAWVGDPGYCCTAMNMSSDGELVSWSEDAAYHYADVRTGETGTFLLPPAVLAFGPPVQFALG